VMYESLTVPFSCAAHNLAQHRTQMKQVMIVMHNLHLVSLLTLSHSLFCSQDPKSRLIIVYHEMVKWFHPQHTLTEQVVVSQILGNPETLLWCRVRGQGRAVVNEWRR
jgi:hypothetical protein